MSLNNNSLTQLALQKFEKNFWGVFSLCIMVMMGLLSVFAYVISPDNSQNANQMHLSIHSKKPGFKVLMLTVPSKIENQQSFFSKTFYGVKTSDTEIPITSSQVNNDNLVFTEYASDELEGITKTLSLNIFPNQNSSSKICGRNHNYRCHYIWQNMS